MNFWRWIRAEGWMLMLAYAVALLAFVADVMGWRL